jgi:hypothetical protein
VDTIVTAATCRSRWDGRTLTKQRLEQHQRVITQLTNRAASVEVQLEGLTITEQAAQEEREAFEGLVEERASVIRDEYQESL